SRSACPTWSWRPFPPRTRPDVLDGSRASPVRRPTRHTSSNPYHQQPGAQMLRVVEWSTGTVGRHAIAGIDARPDLELVGVYVSNPAKDGRDAGELADLGRDLGIKATTDKQALIDLQPDCIVHTAMTDDRLFQAAEDLISFLEAGLNVVSSGPVVLIFPSDALGADIPRRIAEACARTGASLYVNGIDPGFANDVLPLTITSVSQRIDLVR